MFGANVVILTQIYDELSCRQAEFPRILKKIAKMPLKDLHFQYQLKASWCMFGVNLVIPAPEFSCGQIKFTDRRPDVQTDRWTDAGNNNTP